MAWPTLQDYNEAVQNPPLAFSDPELRTGTPELNALGLPRAIAGNFACVYKIQIGSRHWAARCFSSEVSDQQRRYEAISTHLKGAGLPYTVPFEFLPNGINVAGANYPLIKMEWLQGEPLNQFVARKIGFPGTLLSLARRWTGMVSDLRKAGLAHGDLQHGNVVVVNDELRLIDYDGMYVPALAGNQSNECGHRNYQLPSRTGQHFGPYLDNFSAWVIYVSLVALAVHPELWADHGGGDECLIFRQEDYLRPEQSAIFKDLAASPNAELRFLIELFLGQLSRSPQAVAALDGKLPEIAIEITKPWWAEQPAAAAESKPGMSRLQNVAPAIPDPSWILDSLLEEAHVEKLRFPGRALENRLIFLGSAGMVGIGEFFTGLAAGNLLAISAGVLGLDLVVCFARYRGDPRHAEFKQFKRAAREALGKARELQAAVAALTAEAQALQAKLEAGERELNGQKNALSAKLPQDLQAAQTELDAALETIAQRRREAAAAETSKLNSLQNTLGSRIAELGGKLADANSEETSRVTRCQEVLQSQLLRLDANTGKQIRELEVRLAGLKRKEADEQQSTLKALQKIQIENVLRDHLIAEASIDGINDEFKSRLHHGGFHTAVDIDARIRRVRGLGPTIEAALLRWRQGLELEARREMSGLLPEEMAEIAEKYRQKRESLEFEKQCLQTDLKQQTKKLQAAALLDLLEIEKKYRNARLVLESEMYPLRAQLEAQTQSARQFFASGQQSSSAEERRSRAVFAGKKAPVQEAHDAKIAVIDRQMIVQQAEAEAALDEITGKCRAAQKQILEIQWQSAKREQEGRRFAGLRFQNYLRTVISS